MNAQNGFEQLKAAFPDAKTVVDGAVGAIYLPAAKFKAGGADRQMSLLLYPEKHGGYDTRLFFEQEIVGRGQNWTPHVVAGRAWVAPSFNHVPPTLPLLQMLAAHLRVVA